MERNIQDYLHFYLGCEVQIAQRRMSTDGMIDNTRVGLFQGYWDNERRHARIQFRTGPEGHVDLLFLKPILRPLSDMTEEEWKKCFELSRGMVDQYISDKIQKMAHNEILVTLGYKQFHFGYHYGDMDNDVRIGHGLCFYLKSSLIRDEMSVSDKGLEGNKSHFHDVSEERVYNIDHIFIYLLSKGFDLFGLIESGLAIDKTTLKP